MLGITGARPQALRYAPAVRRAEALEQIERSMGRIGRAGSSVMAARRRAARAGVEVSAPGMGMEAGGDTKFSSDGGNGGSGAGTTSLVGATSWVGRITV